MSVVVRSVIGGRPFRLLPLRRAVRDLALYEKEDAPVDLKSVFSGL
jgi:hypothetical protein